MVKFSAFLMAPMKYRKRSSFSEEYWNQADKKISTISREVV
jgi:hypothetical protein